MRGEAVPPEPKAKSSARKRKRGKQPAKDPADEPNGEATEGDGDVPAGGDGDEGAALPTADGGKPDPKPKRKTPKVTPDDVLSKWKLQDQMWKKNTIPCVAFLKQKVFGVMLYPRGSMYGIFTYIDP